MARPRDTNLLLSRGIPLTKPILVGGTLATAWVVVPFVCLLAAGGLALLGLIRNEWPLVIFALVPTPFLAGFTLLATVVQLARRRWLEVTLDGFVLTKRDGSRQEFRDDQIVSVAQWTLPTDSGGFKRRVTMELQTDERLETIECFYVLDAGVADPLYPMIDRNIRSLVERTTVGLDEGARLTGDGWHYDREGLHVRRGPSVGVYPVEALTYLAWFDDQIKFYRNQEYRPFFAIPQASRNADALGNLLWAIMERRETLNDPIGTHPMGRWMYTFKGRDMVIGSVLLVFFVPFLCLFAFMGLWLEQVVLLVLALFCLLIDLLGLWALWRGWSMHLDYHQFGLCQPNRQRMLRFDEIAGMTWHPQHTDLRFEPKPGSSGQVIHYRSTNQAYHINMIVIRDYISGVIAREWWEQLKEKNKVTWTKNLAFLYEELEYTPATLLGRSEPQYAPYGITSYYLFADHMDLFVQGLPKVALQQKTVVRNFYPGLTLLNWIYASMQQTNDQQQPFSTPFPSSETKPRDERIQGRREEPDEE